MQLKPEFLIAINLVASRAVASNLNETMFGIPGALAPMDDLTPAEIDSMKLAGFRWDEQFDYWMVDLKEIINAA